MAITFVIFAGLLTAFSNYYMRKSVDAGGSSKSFLMIQLSIAFLVAILLNPIRTHFYAINLPMLSLGLGAGMLFGFMMLFLGKALENGPPGLTFALLSSATVIPGLIMALFFGPSFGFDYKLWHGLGSFIVILGLFWAGWGVVLIRDRNRWIFFSLAAVCLHALFLSTMQYRSLAINFSNSPTFLNSHEAQSQWFMPLIYFVAALMQAFTFFSAKSKRISSIEWRYGVFGGAANSISTFFLIWATEIAGSLEQAIIFPIFSVTIILLCNFWGQRFYQENVNWKASQLSVLGLFIATVDWKAISSFFFP